jgi:hypothetical protein
MHCLRPQIASEVTFYSSVADSDPFDTDPDPAFHFDTFPGPDTAFQFDTDPGPDTAFQFDTDLDPTV